MIYLIHKEKGISSFKFINDFKNKKGFQKIGHCGTLDPLASGLLLVATDEDTKLIQYLDQKTKTYFARAKIGIETSTYDSEGEIVNISPKLKFEKEQIEKILSSFKGISMQKPPKYSAKKIKGKRAYDLARQNIDFELKENQINISKISLIDYNLEKNYFDFEVVVSRGTYIRSLIHDIGKKMGTYAFMEELQRIKIGDFFLKNTEKIKKLNPIDLISLDKIILTKNQLEKISKGFFLETKKQNGFYSICYKDKIIGFGKVDNNKLKSSKLIGKKIDDILRRKDE